MIKTPHDKRVILIGGPSNAGKTTLAKSLALWLGWNYRSTDKLARYPGRPWRKNESSVPDHLAEHYLSQTANELFTGVVNHYRNMRPIIKNLVIKHATDLSTEPLILEGSAIWPEFIMTLDMKNVVAIWLAPTEEVLEQRLQKESCFQDAQPRDKEIIRKFMQRALLYNKHMKVMIEQFGLDAISIDESISTLEIIDRCWEIINRRIEA